MYFKSSESKKRKEENYFFNILREWEFFFLIIQFDKGKHSTVYSTEIAIANETLFIGKVRQSTYHRKQLIFLKTEKVTQNLQMAQIFT